jgi:hypothetical protein
MLFLLLLLDAMATLVDLFVTHVAATFAASLVTALVATSAIAALVRQQGSGVSRAVKALTWATIGYVGLMFLLGYVLFIILSIRQPGVARDQWEYFQMVSEMSPFESPFLLAIFIFCIATSLSLGITGTILLGRSGLNQGPAATAGLEAGSGKLRADSEA